MLQATRSCTVVPAMSRLTAVRHSRSFHSSYLQFITRLKLILILGVNCQKLDWPTHRASCKPPNFLLKISLFPGEIRDPFTSRTISCPARATFADLHQVVQIAFCRSRVFVSDFKIVPEYASEPLVRLVVKDVRGIGRLSPAVLGKISRVSRNTRLKHL